MGMTAYRHRLLQVVDGGVYRKVHLAVPGAAQGSERGGEVGDGADVLGWC